MTELRFIPYSELARVRGADVADVDKARIFATLCRINTLYMIMRAGSGHIGTSFSAMDIVVWLYLNELRLPETADEPGDCYYSSKGHDVPGLYAVLLGLGRLDFDLLHRLRRLDGLPGHPDVGTPEIVTNTGSLGMGVSKAKGMAIANRLKGRRSRVYVLTGDGELQEGQFWESLPSVAQGGFGEITVIVDHNKIQSDTWVRDVNDLGDLEAKFAAFGWHVERCDGNDIDALKTVFERLEHITDRPKVVIADTIKGAGVSFMAHTAMSPDQVLYRFHSGSPDAESYSRAAGELIGAAEEQMSRLGLGTLTVSAEAHEKRQQPEAPQRLVAAYSRALLAEAEHNPRVVALDADLMLDCGLIPFKDRFPERFVECGIAEQDMVSAAGGLALNGMLPVVHSFACFLSTRPNEQIYNNASERTRIMYVGALAGVLPAGPGHSHQSVRDISTLAANPGLILVQPATEAETEQAVSFCLNQATGSTYLRLVSIPCGISYGLPSDHRLEYGRGVAVTEGDDAVLFAYGPVMLEQAFLAARHLRDTTGLGLKVINLPWLNRVDREWLADTVKGASAIFTLDDHYITGGQGVMLASQLAEQRLLGGVRFRRLGLTDLPLCGTNAEVLTAHGLDSHGLSKSIAEELEG